MSDTKVKVAVRVRPMNRRELELNTKCVVEMEGNQTVLHPPPSNTKQGERAASGWAPWLELAPVFCDPRPASRHPDNEGPDGILDMTISLMATFYR
ncbi:kinesin-like protein KIF13A isoform X1 [Rhinolophus ferrumequinum]|uniref:kinesin-like protein KIF13A isoform X1 n=1 Tax=Rhinolophus ferrumequinum TaxID=59479 RepID=UPI00140F536C|nr:kinesin-like protein KIF13A isoform X1 [Rhinolophus ferrumequinum]